MHYDGLLLSLPREIRIFIIIFILVMTTGFITGLFFVRQTDATEPSGIEVAYMGNEDDPDAEVMIFKKSEREMLTIIHTHILSLSMVFFMLGALVWIAKLPVRAKYFLSVEPFLSLILTFGGLYFMWKGISWMKYVVFISGIVMTATYVIAAGIVVFQALTGPKPD